jgi:hypothetical protein
MIVLVIVVLISSFIAPTVHEHFVEADQEVPLKSINLCGRNIVFPYFSRNAFTASQRSLPDYESAKTNPVGKCRIDKINGIVNESHSIVHENSLFYNLKHACMAFRVKDAQAASNRKLTFNLSTANPADLLNVTSLVLLNPLYVEFVINEHSTSVAYRCVNGRIDFSNSKDIKNFNDFYSLVFYPVAKLNGASNNCDSTFDYESLSKAQKEITQEDITKMFYSNNIVNMKVYYLDTLSSSFQNVGRKLKLIYNDSGSTNIFETDYQKYFQDKYTTNIYEFMNNVALMHTNYVYPVFTFKFSINVTKEGHFQTPGEAKNLFAKVFMDNDTGTYGFCSNTNDTSTGKNNLNMLGLAIEGVDQQYYNIIAFTGTPNFCNLGAANNLVVKLPYLLQNNYINVAVTVTPNEKIIFAKWSDISNGFVAPNFNFGRIGDCGDQSSYSTCLQKKQEPASTPAANNSMLQLFTVAGDNRAPLSNIRFHYNKNIVRDLDSCTLGYVNFVKELNT